ncbi:hypothetical protein [Methylobacterium sp. V23]|uniref:hypothetical protein n=1 Tax=Methylobacterium sp. V23 TaxID=2044878 RepID=UPI0011B0B1B5|nr:hypothetical protein [Methylobacterium sp. V23]
MLLLPTCMLRRHYLGVSAVRPSLMAAYASAARGTTACLSRLSAGCSFAILRIPSRRKLFFAPTSIATELKIVSWFVRR